jgi:hypothetical protein
MPVLAHWKLDAAARKRPPRPINDSGTRGFSKDVQLQGKDVVYIAQFNQQRLHVRAGFAREEARVLKQLRMDEYRRGSSIVAGWDSQGLAAVRTNS